MSRSNGGVNLVTKTCTSSPGLEIEKSALRANVHDKKEAHHPPKRILPAVVFLDAADSFPFTEFFNF
jgi:hypothetical protein